MGQGHYVALAFGVLNPPRIDDDEREDDFRIAIEKAAGRRVHTSYESKREYMAIFVAENAGVDDDAAVPQTCLLADAANGEEWPAVHAAWERAQKAAKEFGIDLPDGQPLLVVDYD